MTRIPRAAVAVFMTVLVGALWSLSHVASAEVADGQFLVRLPESNRHASAGGPEDPGPLKIAAETVDVVTAPDAYGTPRSGVIRTDSTEAARQRTEHAAAAAKFVAKAKDISVFLMELGPIKPTHPLPIRATYHDACHLRHAQQVATPPRQLLAMIPGLELVALPVEEKASVPITIAPGRKALVLENAEPQAEPLP